MQFTDIVAAFMAQQSLNNFYLTKYNASLSVKWVINKKPSIEQQEPADSPIKSAQAPNEDADMGSGDANL